MIELQRQEFENWCKLNHQFNTGHNGDGYVDEKTYYAFIGWNARAETMLNLCKNIAVGGQILSHAQDFLSAGMEILGERGKQYGSDDRECSFPQVAQAFNAITGNELKGSDICLMLALVKQVRQYAQPDRFHEDSAVDGVNYTALQAQELKKERR